MPYSNEVPLHMQDAATRLATVAVTATLDSIQQWFGAPRAEKIDTQLIVRRVARSIRIELPAIEQQAIDQFRHSSE